MAAFTSKDLDFQGGRDDVLRLAKELGHRAQLPHPREMTALAGIVPFQMGGSPTTVEVVRFIAGVRPGVVEKSAAEYEFAGHRVRVADPISLLSCKLYLALHVDQKERRDVEHLRIMLVCVRAFLRETLRGVEAGALPARGWLGGCGTSAQAGRIQLWEESRPQTGSGLDTGAAINGDCGQRSPRGQTVPRKAAGPMADQAGPPGLTSAFSPSTTLRL